MNAVLIMTKTNGDKREFPLNKDHTIIGRKVDCDLRIPLASVSREHCRLELRDEELFLRDLGSANGTYHNGNRVQETALSAGDRVKVGPVEFTVVIDGVGAENLPAPSDPGGSTMEMEAIDEPLVTPMALDADDSDIIDIELSSDADDDDDDSIVLGEDDDIEIEVQLDDEAAADVESGELDEDAFVAFLDEDDDGEASDALDEFDFLLEDDDDKR